MDNREFHTPENTKHLVVDVDKAHQESLLLNSEVARLEKEVGNLYEAYMRFPKVQEQLVLALREQGKHVWVGVALPDGGSENG